MDIKCTYDKLVDVDSLIPNPKNPNKHPDRQIEMLSKIIKYQGVRSPIVVSNRSGFIVAGHGRLESLKKLGIVEAPVDYQDFESEAAEMAHMIADNKIAEMAESDDDMIKELALELPDGFDLELAALPDLDLSFVDEPINEKELDENLTTENTCPSCGYEW